MTNFRIPPLRDKAYLKAMRDMPCIITGRRASDHESVVPAHIGTLGKGVKSPDNEALPMLNSIHMEAHQRGEMTVLRERLPDDVLRAALRALARERYEGWKQGI